MLVVGLKMLRSWLDVLEKSMASKNVPLAWRLDYADTVSCPGYDFSSVIVAQTDLAGKGGRHAASIFIANITAAGLHVSLQTIGLT